MNPLERVLADAGLQQARAALLLVPTRAERADVEGLCLQRPAQGRLVELVVVGEDDDGRLVVGPDLRIRLVRPRDEQLVGRGDPLAGREGAACVGHDRPPAEQPGRPAERLGGVDRAVREQPRRRAVHLGEDGTAVQLDQPVPRAALQLGRVRSELGRPVAERLAVLGHEQLPADPVAGDDGEEHAAPARLDERGDALDQLNPRAPGRRRSRRRTGGRRSRPARP